MVACIPEPELEVWIFKAKLDLFVFRDHGNNNKSFVAAVRRLEPPEGYHHTRRNSSPKLPKHRPLNPSWVRPGRCVSKCQGNRLSLAFILPYLPRQKMNLGVYFVPASHPYKVGQFKLLKATNVAISAMAFSLATHLFYAKDHTLVKH